MNVDKAFNVFSAEERSLVFVATDDSCFADTFNTSLHVASVSRTAGVKVLIVGQVHDLQVLRRQRERVAFPVYFRFGTLEPPMAWTDDAVRLIAVPPENLDDRLCSAADFLICVLDMRLDVMKQLGTCFKLLPQGILLYKSSDRLDYEGFETYFMTRFERRVVDCTSTNCESPRCTMEYSVVDVRSLSTAVLRVLSNANDTSYETLRFNVVTMNLYQILKNTNLKTLLITDGFECKMFDKNANITVIRNYNSFNVKDAVFDVCAFLMPTRTGVELRAWLKAFNNNGIRCGRFVTYQLPCDSCDDSAENYFQQQQHRTDARNQRFRRYCQSWRSPT